MAGPKETNSGGEAGDGPTQPIAPKDGADKIIEFGAIITKIGKILKECKDDKERIRVIKTVATWYDVDLGEGR